MWSVLSTILHTATAEVAPPLSLQPDKPWVSARTLALVQKRREVYATVRLSGGGRLNRRARRKLGSLRHQITRQLQRDKQANAMAVAERMWLDWQANRFHAFYRTLNRLGPDGPSQRPGPLRGPHGELLHSCSQRAVGFAAHFEQVLRCGQPVAQEVLQSAAAQPWAAAPDSFPWESPTEEQLGAAVMGLKHWRAADPDGLWAEQLQAAWEHSPAFRSQLHSLVLLALQQGMPAVVKEAEGLPFFKKGDPADPGNYRCIQLVSMLRKIIATALSQQLRDLAEQRLQEYQCGFRPQRGCSDQIFSVRRLSELSISLQQRLYIAFVDLRKAFDSVNRAALWAILRASGLPEPLVRALADLHTDTTCRIKVGASYSRPFIMEWGVQQGCPLAPLLFNIFIDWVVREALAACPDCGVTLQYGFSDRGALAGPPARGSSEFRLPFLMLADDIAALASSAEGLERFMKALEVACQRWGLIISPGKTELMLVGGAAATACEGCLQLQPEGSMLLCDRCEAGWHMACLDPPLSTIPPGTWLCPTCQAAAPDPSHPPTAAAAAAAGAADGSGSKWRPPITIGGSVLSWTENFKYLGAHITATGGLDTELSHRIGLAAAVFRRLQRPFFSQRAIPMRIRMIVFTVMVLSVLLYGCESWALSGTQLLRLEVFQRGLLRQILGVRRSDRVRDDELYARCAGVERIETHWRRRALRWLGHIGRMDESRITKRLLWAALPGGSRRRGAPSTSLSSIYTKFLDTLSPNLAKMRRDQPNGGRGFSWLDACKERDAWRQMIG